MIQVENVSFHYPNGGHILNKINFTIKKGDFTAIIGQNGAGKTTLLKLFNGLLRAVEGKVIVGGLDASVAKTSFLAKKVGFLFQNPDHQIFCSTVYDEIAFGLKNTGNSQEKIDHIISQAAKKVGIHPLLQENPFSLGKGQRQRVALASVLALGSDILVLDEPTTGQDYHEGIEILEIIKELNLQGKTIIMVTHDMELVARYAHKVIILQKGGVLANGPTHEVLSKPEILSLSGLQSPQIHQLSRKFHKLGLFQYVHTPEQMFEEILTCQEDAKNVCTG